jgi:hypothetical protein
MHKYDRAYRPGWIHACFCAGVLTYLYAHLHTKFWCALKGFPVPILFSRATLENLSQVECCPSALRLELNLPGEGGLPKIGSGAGGWVTTDGRGGGYQWVRILLGGILLMVFPFLIFRTKRIYRDIYNNTAQRHKRSCGAMDNASAYGAEDCRFESCQDRGIHLRG